MTTISFTGDIAFSHYFNDSWDNKFLLSDEIVQFLGTSDYTVLNLEGAVVPAETSVKPFTHTTSDKAIDTLLRIKGNIWSLANNHIMDYNGPEGLLNTIDLANKNNCTTIGAGKNIQQAEKPFTITSSGGICIISAVYDKGGTQAKSDQAGCLIWEEHKLKELLQLAKKEYRWCVLVIHGGDEFSHMPLPYIRRKYHKFLDFGADIIVGHHPHVVQNYETMGNKVIFYSLGNFIFDTNYQRERYGTDVGVLLKIQFNNENFTFIPFPIKINRIKNTIEKGTLPEIFCDIGDREYNALWPFAAAALVKTERMRNAFIKPDVWGKCSNMRWLWVELKGCRRLRGFQLMLGRIFSKLSFSNFKKNKIIDYLKNVF